MLQWGLAGAGISLAGLTLLSGSVYATNSVKIPPLPEFPPDLTFDPMSVSRDFDYGTIKSENGRKIREFEVVSQSSTLQLNRAITFISWNLNQSVLGSTLRATEGDRVRIIFHNEDGHSHSMHFHGTHP